MTKAPVTFRRLALIASFTGTCFVLVLILWAKGGGPTPLAPSGYRVHILLPQTGGLGMHSDVRVAGVTVGHVISVELAKPLSTGRSDVLIELERPFAPLRSDAVARVRQKSVLGEGYVALSFGSHNAPYIRDGGTLDARRAQHSVASDEVLGSFDPETRRALQIWQQTEGAAISGRGSDLNAAIGTLRPWAVDTSRLLSIVNGQGDDVAALLRNGGAIAGGLADREQAIQLLARSGDRAFNATGSQAASLKAAFAELPGFERESEATLRSLTGLADARAGDVRTLRRELAPLSLALEALAADAPALHRAVDAAPAAARAGETGLPDLERLLGRTPPFLGALDPALRSLNPALRFVSGRRESLNSFIANLAAATQGTTTGPGSKAPLHYLRAMPVLSPMALGPLSRRPGVNRANAYPLLGAHDLRDGLASYDTRSCTNPTPRVSSAPSPELDQTTRDQLAQYVYVPDPDHVAAPPCKAQGPVPGFGTSFPVLAADPPTGP